MSPNPASGKSLGRRLSGGDGRGLGGGAGAAGRPARHRGLGGGDRRQPGRHAGHAVGAGVSGAHPPRPGDRLGAEAHRARTSPSTRWRARPSSPIRISTAATTTSTAWCRRAACAWRACSATSPISPTTRWRRSSAAGMRQADLQLQLRRGLRDRVLPALPGRQVRRLLRRQHLSHHHQGARLLRSGARLRRPARRGAGAGSSAEASSSSAFSTDWRFAPERSREIVYGAGAQRPRCQLRRGRKSMAGHDSFLLDDPHYHAVVDAYLKRIVL
jgi:hypothetical protein